MDVIDVNSDSPQSTSLGSIQLHSKMIHQPEKKPVREFQYWAFFLDVYTRRASIIAQVMYYKKIFKYVMYIADTYFQVYEVYVYHVQQINEYIWILYILYIYHVYILLYIIIYCHILIYIAIYCYILLYYMRLYYIIL